MTRSFAAAMALAMLSTTAAVRAAPPQLSHTVPAALAAGQTVELTCYGSNLQDAALWIDLPAGTQLASRIEQNGARADRVTFRVAVPADQPLGFYALRVTTPEGASNLRLIMVDDLPGLAESGDNKSRETAQEISPPLAIDGACEAESYDYFKLRGVAGQRLSVEAVARRLGSPLDPVIRLLDEAGHELAYSDDDESTGADGRFVYQFRRDGTYYIEIRDIRYAGGAAHRYRLRVGDFPLAMAPFPLGGQKGTSVKVVPVGRDLDPLPPLLVSVPADLTAAQVPLSVAYAAGQGSTPLSLLAGEAIEQVEFEPNDSAETASPLALAGAVNGRFARPGDRDYYQFEALKGDRFVFSGRTRELRTPTDLFLRLYDDAGKLLVEAEDSGLGEGFIDHTFAADGRYRLVLEDLHRRGGDEFVYRVEIERWQPGFTLTVDADLYNVPRGGVFNPKVVAVRRGYDGPIQVQLVPPIAGLAVKNNVIAEKKNDATLSITLPPDLPSGTLHHLQLVGEAKVGDRLVRAGASTLAPLRAAPNGLDWPPAPLDGRVAVGVGPVYPKFFELKAVPQVVPLWQLAGKAAFKVEAKKLNNFDDKITLALEGLPPSVSAAVPAIDKGKTDALIELTAPPTLAEGEIRLRVVGSATFNNQPQTAALDDIVLRVAPPLEVELQVPARAAPGGTLKAQIRVKRHLQQRGPVSVSVRLPAGVSGPRQFTVAAEADAVDARWQVAAEALAGPVELVATASTQVSEREITVDSSIATVRIERP